VGRRRRRSGRVDDGVTDAGLIFALLPWWASLIAGVLLFGVFYFLIPHMIEGSIESERGNLFYPMIAAILAYRTEIIQGVGVAILLVSIYFSFRNLVDSSAATGGEVKGVSFIAKIIARYID
jgi:hypothetical protein